MLGGPRDPRVDQISMRDLADYARSTGPENVGQLPKALNPPTAPAATAAGIAAATAYSRSTASATQIEKPLGSPVSTSSKNAESQPVQASSRLKYQARDAHPSRNRETADLIDFIREGPPRAPGDHRIDRNVAPFRRTMDSDDLNSLAPERDRNGAGSVASTQNSSVATKSMQESLNSRTGLLDSTNMSNGRYTSSPNAAPVATVRQTAPGEETMPKRTQRRVRDPYAIEYSDDELDEDVVTPKQKVQEESLIDFLRNTVPPPAMAMQPVAAASPSTANLSTTPKESSNSALKDRILRKASLSGVSRNGTLKKSTAVSPPGYNGTTNGTREESPHQPTESTHAAHLDRGRQKPRAVIEPRDPRSGGDSRELAAYLMNSGPPATETRLPLSQPIKEEAGFLKFFSRRRTLKR
jgi:hypothetical protein